MLGNPAEAEELVQQAFVRAWKGLPGFRAESSFKTWLYRIATNLSINRTKRRKPVVELPETLAAPSSEEPEERYRQRQREELVRSALALLPGDQRSALTLATYEDMSYRDIARAMGKTERAVDSLLFRARTNLRRLLEPARKQGVV